MSRRSRLAITFVALVMVGSSIVHPNPDGQAQAADPISEAKARHEELLRTVQRQERQLGELRTQAAELDKALAAAQAELADLTAEYDRVYGLLVQVRAQVEETRARIAELRAQIAELDAELTVLAEEIEDQTDELRNREALLEDRLRNAYERSQTTLLEVLLSVDSFEAATNQVGYLLTVSEQDRALADDIRLIREDLRDRRLTLRDGRRALDKARAAAEDEEATLAAREAELADMEVHLAALKVAADEKRRQQEDLLNATLAKQADVEKAYAQNMEAAKAQEQLVARLVAEEAERQRKLEEARRREEERRRQEEARRRAADEAARQQAAQRAASNQAAQRPPDQQAARQATISGSGFRWPYASGFRITQEFGPTGFRLEPPYTYGGVYYPHFHTGLDMAAGCGTPIVAAREGVVAASGQPLWPYDSAYGVIISHGGGLHTWYWHLQPRVIVRPGQVVTTGQLIGYEGTTGFSTGCHLHFAVNINGRFENPRFYLP